MNNPIERDQFTMEFTSMENLNRFIAEFKKRNPCRDLTKDQAKEELEEGKC